MIEIITRYLFKLIENSERKKENAVIFFSNDSFNCSLPPGEIKALKTLVWHLSREPMKEISSLKKINNQ